MDTSATSRPLPIEDDDATIERMLAQGHMPTLVAALVHITGEETLLTTERPLDFSVGPTGQGGLSEQEQERARDRALHVLRDLRAGRLKPAVPPEEQLAKILNFLTGQVLDADYVQFLMDELGIGERRSAAVTRALRASAPKQQRAIVIGAGMSGLLMAHRLHEAGVDYVVIEKNSDVGGTWLENTYPGCRVDSPNHSYSYSLAPKRDWPQYFSRQPVLLEYFSECADRFDVRRNIRFDTEVTEAWFDEQTKCWNVRVSSKDGALETLTADVLISAVGQLNRPRRPDIPGLDSFEGPAFHSARWRHDVDLTNKRVAVIGTGASAFQFVPEIVESTAELLLFQRSAPWLMPAPHYHDDIPEGMRWLLAHVPYYERWYRFHCFWQTTHGLLKAVRVDPEWSGDPKYFSAEHKGLQTLLETSIRAQTAGSPEIQEAAIPDYPAGSKRMLLDNGKWLKALQRDDLTLITQPIERVTSTGLITSDGREHDVDVLIYGTGFHAGRFLHPMTIRGRGGLSLNDRWQGDARAYLGVTVPGFPNFFCLYGPNTNIVVNGSIIFFSECGSHYILDCLRLLREGGFDSLECRQDVHDAHNEWIDRENARMAWGCGTRSWYINEQGRSAQNWPGSLLEYWRRTLRAEESDFVLL